MSAIEVHRVARPQLHSRAIVPAFHHLLVRPIASDGASFCKAIDVTDAVVRALAHELWQQNAGNETLNWLEAERLIQHVLDLAWIGQQRPAAAGLRHQEVEVTPDRRTQPLPVAPTLPAVPAEKRQLSLAA